MQHLSNFLLFTLFLVPAAAQPANSIALVRERLSFAPDQIHTLLSGDRIVETLETKEREEVAVFGAVKVNAPLDLYLREAGKSKVSKSGRGILEEGRFSKPARLADLQGLSFDPSVLEEIKKCKPGDCSVKMAATNMEQFHRTVDWSSPQAFAQASQVGRQGLINLVNAYYAGGPSALGDYDDKGKPVPIAKEVAALLAGADYLHSAAPSLASYLSSFPKSRPPNLKHEAITWSKVNFGLKPVVRVNHSMTIHKPVGKDREVLLVSNQLFASHYFEAALELQDLIEDRSNPRAPAFYFITVNRARSATLNSLLGRMLRSTVVSSTRSSTEKTLDFIKAEYEAQYQRSKGK